MNNTSKYTLFFVISFLRIFSASQIQKTVEPITPPVQQTTSKITITEKQTTQSLEPDNRQNSFDDIYENNYDEDTQTFVNDTEAETLLQKKIDYFRSTKGLKPIGGSLSLNSSEKETLFLKLQSQRTKFGVSEEFQTKIIANLTELNLNVFFDEICDNSVGCSEKANVVEYLNRTLAFLESGTLDQSDQRKQYLFSGNNLTLLDSDTIINMNYSIFSDEGSCCQTILIYQYELPVEITTTPKITTSGNTTKIPLHEGDIWAGSASSLQRTLIFLYAFTIFLF